MVMPNVNYDNKRPGTACKGLIHVVEAGDTLYQLARRYDVKLFDIMRVNPYVNVYNLQIGDEICIPTMPARPEKTYIVNEGDSIKKVLEAFNTDFSTLAGWNPMLLDAPLPEGLILKLPLVQPREDELDD